MRDVVLTPRRAIAAGIIGGIAAVALRGRANGQPAQPEVLLFRIVGPRDTITAGVTAAELAGWGRGEPVTVLAERLVAAGQLTLWSYAVGRAADGSLRMEPRGRIAVLRNDAVRIEPYRSAHPVAAPSS